MFAAGLAARMNFKDRDWINFAHNEECLEGNLETWGVFGHGLLDNLTLGAPTPIGAQKANLSAEAE